MPAITEQTFYYVAAAGIVLLILILIFLNRYNSKSKNDTKNQENNVKPVVTEVESSQKEEEKQQLVAKPIVEQKVEEKPKLVAKEVVETKTEEEPQVVAEPVKEEPQESTNPNLIKTYSLVRYRKSFVAKLVLQPELQDIYKEIRDKILSYNKVKAHLSFKCERISLGRKTLIKMFIRGKKIYIYYALDPNAQDEKYHLIDVSNKKIGETLPSLHKVLSNRSVLYAKQLVDKLMKENETEELSEDKIVSTNYDEYLYNRTFDELLAEKLIIEYEVKRKSVIESQIAADDDDDIDDEMEDEEDEVITPELTATNIDKYISDTIIDELVTHKSTHVTGRMEIINLDTLSLEFKDGDTVNLETLISRKIVGKNTKRVKILARGSLDKKLHVEAYDFSKQAMKLILINGGTITVLS